MGERKRWEGGIGEYEDGEAVVLLGGHVNPRRGMTPRSDVYTVCNTHKQGRVCGGVSPRCAMQPLEKIVPRSAAAARYLEENVQSI